MKISDFSVLYNCFSSQVLRQCPFCERANKQIKDWEMDERTEWQILRATENVIIAFLEWNCDT